MPSNVIGTRFSHFEIIAKLGEGGMGVVYRARDLRLQRTVAIKLVSPQCLADAAAQARLLAEARAASALNHPNICTIHEIGEADGQTFIAMEHVEGEPLSALVAKEGLPIETALRYALQIADALSHAHDRGLIHRDLKSANIVITPEGRAKVLDFGLAKRLEGDEVLDITRTQAALTQPGTIAGTLHYLSPELLRGERADERSDVWAFGVLLHEAITGALPFQGDTMFELTATILRERPSPLPSWVPPGLGTVIRRCLAKEPQQRYQRGSELRAALEAVQVGASARAAPRKRRQLQALASLAVLPFANEGGDPDAEFLSDGLTESIINNLAQLPKLRVMARSSIFRYKGRQVDPQVIGRELNVRAVLTGRVNQRRDVLMIAAELVDATTGWQLWGAQYNRRLSDIFAVQEEIAQEISDKLRLKLTGEEKRRLRRRHTDDPHAYQLYLKGRYFWNRRTEESFKKGVEYFEQAIAQDPAYALAYTGLADCYNILGDYGFLPPHDAFPRAKAAATRALELDETLAEGHTSLAYVQWAFDWDWAAAEWGFKRAVTLQPGYATAHQWYAEFLTARGRHDEASAEIARAQLLDPLSLIVNAVIGWAFYFARRYDEAIEQCRKILELDPHFARAHIYLGRALVQKGMFDEALAAFQRGIALSGDSPTYLAELGHAYAVAGRLDEAQHVLASLEEQRRRRYISPYGIATIHMALGDLDRAFEWFDKACADRAFYLVFLNVEPAVDRLRDHPRFATLLRRVKLIE